MKNKFYQLVWGALLPVLAGCNGGGGGSTSSFSSVGSLFAGTDSGSTVGTTVGTTGTTTLASISSLSSLTSSAITNPEPASLLLLGGGLVTLGYFKSLKKNLR